MYFPYASILLPYIAITKALTNIVERGNAKAGELAKSIYVRMRLLGANRFDYFYGALAFYTAVSNLQRKIVEQSGKAKLVPLQPVMDGYEIIIDIRIVVIASLGSIIACPKAMRLRDT